MKQVWVETDGYIWLGKSIDSEVQYKLKGKHNRKRIAKLPDTE